MLGSTLNDGDMFKTRFTESRAGAFHSGKQLQAFSRLLNHVQGAQHARTWKMIFTREERSAIRRDIQRIYVTHNTNETKP